MTPRKFKNMAEFAEWSGISRPTLSRFFDDPQSVRPATRQRIEEALAKADYRPNIHAVSLNRRKPRNIGIIVPLISDPFYAETVRQIELRCLEEGYWAIVLSSHGRADIEARAIQTLMSLSVAGAVVAPLGVEANQALFDSLGAEIPLVFFDSKMEGDYPFIGTDNEKSISLITQYLWRTGSHPSFLNMPLVNRNAYERRDAYISSMEKLGGEPILLDPAPDSWEFEAAGYKTAETYLAGKGFPTDTVLCANDRIAFGVMSAAYRAGVQIGRTPGSTLRVAGHDDHPLSRYTCPGLTTVAQDYVKMAQTSIDILLGRIGDGASNGAHNGTVLMDATLVMRDSA